MQADPSLQVHDLEVSTLEPPFGHAWHVSPLITSPASTLTPLGAVALHAAFSLSASASASFAWDKACSVISFAMSIAWFFACSTRSWTELCRAREWHGELLRTSVTMSAASRAAVRYIVVIDRMHVRVDCIVL